MKALLLILLALTNLNLNAKVSVLFHPYHDTFGAIVERMRDAQDTIDLALYNIDSSDSNPVIKYIKSDELQARLKAGDLTIRLIFEGYSSKEDNHKKMLELEAMGMDVRAVGSSKKMHHKFAVIDGHLFNASVITGSANWSMSSRKNYNENILFFDQEGAIAQSFQKEFNFLWSISKEVGQSKEYHPQSTQEPTAAIGKVLFNRANFHVNSRGRLGKKRGALGFTLTKEVVAAIDNSHEIVEIATTRLKLRPIYNAIIRAAKRGVQVKIIATMGEYDWKNQRNQMTVPQCENEYKRECSSGVNYLSLLAKDNFEGHKNISVRLKFFNLKTNAYLNKQMHSKYLIIDNKTVLSGSFNWSYSGEFNHIENIVTVTDTESQEVVANYNVDFDQLWSLKRDELSKLHQAITTSIQNNTKISCGFSPMSLELPEIDSLLRRGTKHCQ